MKGGQEDGIREVETDLIVENVLQGARHKDQPLTSVKRDKGCSPCCRLFKAYARGKRESCCTFPHSSLLALTNYAGAHGDPQRDDDNGVQLLFITSLVVADGEVIPTSLATTICESRRRSAAW
jgi:hypothetical protein